MANTPNRNVRIPDDQWAALNAQALSRGVSASELIRTALKTVLRETVGMEAAHAVVLACLADTLPGRDGMPKVQDHWLATEIVASLDVNDLLAPVVGGLLEKEETK